MLKQVALIALMGLSASAMAGQWQVKVGGSVVSPTGDYQLSPGAELKAADELAFTPSVEYFFNDNFSAEDLIRLSKDILQAARVRMYKTEYISCPGCGRTLFDLEQTIAQVKAATAHLQGLKIGIMGCIVNGPGEMADADYGYVGAGRGKVSLYRGKECVLKNIPQEEAVEQLLALIEADKQ